MFETSATVRGTADSHKIALENHRWNTCAMLKYPTARVSSLKFPCCSAMNFCGNRAKSNCQSSFCRAICRLRLAMPGVSLAKSEEGRPRNKKIEQIIFLVFACRSWAMQVGWRSKEMFHSDWTCPTLVSRYALTCCRHWHLLAVYGDCF